MTYLLLLQIVLCHSTHSTYSTFILHEDVELVILGREPPLSLCLISVTHSRKNSHMFLYTTLFTRCCEHIIHICARAKHNYKLYLCVYLNWNIKYLQPHITYLLYRLLRHIKQISRRAEYKFQFCQTYTVKMKVLNIW